MEQRAEIFELFADVLPFGVLIVESDWITVSWNRRAEQITGYQRQQVLGRKCQELLLLGCEQAPGEAAAEKEAAKTSSAHGEAAAHE